MPATAQSTAPLYDAFISHTGVDKSTADELRIRLEARGRKIWFDKTCIVPGETILIAIANGLKNSTRVLLLMSAKALESGWVKMEYEKVLHSDPGNLMRRLIPILLSDCEIPDFVEERLYIDARNGLNDDIIDSIDASH